MSSFSEWYPWDRRNEIPGMDQRGVYAIAHFDEPPSGAADPSVVEVVYIGETHGKTTKLGSRLNTFDKAARVGGKKYKHSGGNTYFDEFDGDLDRAHVAIMPIAASDAVLVPTILTAERCTIQSFVNRHGRLPDCNDK